MNSSAPTKPTPCWCLPPAASPARIGRKDAPLQLLIDATNVPQAQSVEGYIQTDRPGTLQDDLGSAPPQPPIQFDVRVLFNPSLDTSIFMVPGVMTMLMVLTTLVLTIIAIVREKELGTFEMLISAPVSKSEVIFGKTLPYVLIGMTNLPLILSVAVFVFHVPMRGSMLALICATLAFVCTTVAMGTLISTFCKNQQQSSMGRFLFMFPAIMFSGLIFPIENMPASVRWLAFIDPLAHYLSSAAQHHAQRRHRLDARLAHRGPRRWPPSAAPSASSASIRRFNSTVPR